ncbi:MAG TPA: TonB-dependent receptor [Terriglobales bacterium]|nr:TonB-dependent receptor [Terriglobales bacterium]
MKIARVLVASCGLLAVCLPALAQTNRQTSRTRQVRGSVQDTSHAAVTGARVTLIQDHSTKTATTADDGTFLFSNVGPAAGVLRVQASGFAEEERKLLAGTQEQIFFILLRPETVSTQLVVTASRSPLPIGQSTESIAVIPAAEIQSSGAMEIDDILRHLAGFDLFRRSSSRTSNPTTQGVSLRGIGSSGASRALILLDGVPATDPFGGWMNWSQIPLESIDRVEVLRGGASDLYGGQALSGVVQMLSRVPEGTDADLDISYGNERTPNASGYLGHAFGNWTASAAGEYFRTDGYIPVEASERGAVDNPANSLHRNGELQIQRQFAPRSRVFVRGLAYDDSRHNGTILELNRTRAWQVSTGLDLAGSGDSLLQIRGYGGTEDYHQTFASVAADRNSETLARLQMTPSRHWGASAQYSRSFATRHTLIAGVDFQNVIGESDDEVFAAGKATSFTDGGGQNRSVGIFGEDIIRLTPKWVLTPVLRFDDWNALDGFSRTIPLSSLNATTTPFANRSETAFDPKLATNYRFNERFALRASVYRSFRSPTLNELYRSFRVGNVLTLDNPQLVSERLTGFEAGPVEKLANGKLTFEQTFFWADVNRPVSNVTLSTTPTLITRMRENLGSTRARGVGAQIDWSVAKFTSLSAQYQFVNATVTSFPANAALVGLRVPEVPQHEFTFQATYANPRFFTIALQGRSTSSVFDDDINTLVLGSYFKLDAFISRPINSSLDIYVAGENLLNQDIAVARTPTVTLGAPLLARVGLQWHLWR